VEIDNPTTLVEALAGSEEMGNNEYNAILILKASQTLVSDILKNCIVNDSPYLLRLPSRSLGTNLVSLYKNIELNFKNDTRSRIIQLKFRMGLEQSLVEWYSLKRHTEWWQIQENCSAVLTWIQVSHRIGAINILNPIKSILDDIDTVNAGQKSYQIFIRQLIGELTVIPRWSELIKYLKILLKREYLHPFFSGTLFITIVELAQDDYEDILETMIRILPTHPERDKVIASYLKTFEISKGAKKFYLHLAACISDKTMRATWLKILITLGGEKGLKVALANYGKTRQIYLTTVTRPSVREYSLNKLLGDSEATQVYREITAYSNKMNTRNNIDKARAMSQEEQEIEMKKLLEDSTETPFTDF
jgi:hypothetical protein